MGIRLIIAAVLGILLAAGIGFSSRVLQFVKSFGSLPLEEVRITIPEGWDRSDIGKYLEGKGIGALDQFLASTKKDFVQNFAVLADKPQKASLEGYLFPDTYRLYKGATVDDVVLKMLANFSSKLTNEEQKAIKASGRSVFEIVTMASIVEKEVPHASDRPIVAGIFWKRLKEGMPLQADSTLNYVTGNKSASLSSEELKIDSPYNTYTNKGLPPTPIGNPGEVALRAAIYPKSSPYWYFLSAPDGSTIFSKTFEEHVAAKRKYLTN
jgi:UPF0755 protein